MSDFSVDLNELDAVVSKLNGLTGFCSDTFDEIARRVKALNSGSGNGVAADAFTTAHAEWGDGAREFAEGTADLSDAARQAHTSYTESVQVNASMMTGR